MTLEVSRHKQHSRFNSFILERPYDDVLHTHTHPNILLSDHNIQELDFNGRMPCAFSKRAYRSTARPFLRNRMV